ATQEPPRPRRSTVRGAAPLSHRQNGDGDPVAPGAEVPEGAPDRERSRNLSQVRRDRHRVAEVHARPHEIDLRRVVAGRLDENGMVVLRVAGRVERLEPAGGDVERALHPAEPRRAVTGGSEGGADGGIDGRDLCSY